MMHLKRRNASNGFGIKSECNVEESGVAGGSTEASGGSRFRTIAAAAAIARDTLVPLPPLRYLCCHRVSHWLRHYYKLASTTARTHSFSASFPWRDERLPRRARRSVGESLALVVAGEPEQNTYKKTERAPNRERENLTEWERIAARYDTTTLTSIAATADGTVPTVTLWRYQCLDSPKRKTTQQQQRYERYNDVSTAPQVTLDTIERTMGQTNERTA